MKKRDFEPVHPGEISIRRISALRLGRVFGMEPQFLLNLQSRYDLLKLEGQLGERLEKEVRPNAA